MDVNNRQLTIYNSAGATRYAVSASFSELDTTLEYEPSFITALPGAAAGYNTHACYLDSSGMKVNGLTRSATSSAGTSTGRANYLCWGGRSNATNRFGRGSYTAVIVWDTAPTGADLTIIDAWCASIGATDDA